VRKSEGAIVACALGIALAVACGESAEHDTDSCRTGSERCACHPNKECDANLECLSDVCVSVDGGAGGGTGGGPIGPGARSGMGGAQTGGVSGSSDGGGSGEGGDDQGGSGGTSGRGGTGGRGGMGGRSGAGGSAESGTNAGGKAGAGGSLARASAGGATGGAGMSGAGAGGAGAGGGGAGGKACGGVVGNVADTLIDNLEDDDNVLAPSRTGNVGASGIWTVLEPRAAIFGERDGRLPPLCSLQGVPRRLSPHRTHAAFPHRRVREPVIASRPRFARSTGRSLARFHSFAVLARLKRRDIRRRRRLRSSPSSRRRSRSPGPPRLSSFPAAR
jgi:hypothetical protein